LAGNSAQVPRLQTVPPVHAAPQRPQFESSASVFTHEVPQRESVPAQVTWAVPPPLPPPVPVPPPAPPPEDEPVHCPRKHC